MAIPNIINLALPNLKSGGTIMADYQKMYYILCAAVDKALDLLPEETEARRILQGAMTEAEEKYIDTAEEE